MGNQDRVFYDRFHLYYDYLNPSREEEFAYYRRILSPTDHVLEAACGSGTLTATIAETCREVVGIDISDAMLEDARRRLPGLSFISADMRDFDLGRKFDKVICPFNSLMHMHSDSDAVSALNRFRTHCADTGEVIVDLFDIDPKFISARTDNLEAFTAIDSQSGQRIKALEDSVFDFGSRTLTLTVRLVDADSGAEVDQATYAMRFYDRDHLTALFHEAGLTPVRIENGYTAGPGAPCVRQIFHAVPAQP